MKNLKTDTIERIISHWNFQIYSEDQLVKFINFLYQSEDEEKIEYSNLYSYVIFTNVSTNVIGEFLDEVNKDDLTKEAWNSISQRLKLPISKDKRKDPFSRYKGKFFPTIDDNNFDGIIKHLATESNGFISTKINITASPTNNNSNAPVNVTHFDQQDFYQSTSEKDSWICFDFQHNRVVPTSYQIKSYHRSASGHHPRTWVIEGKVDKNSEWEILDDQNDCSYLRGNEVSHLFDLKNVKEKEFRYIQIRQTGHDWFGGCHHLSIGSFELYGTLIEEF